MKVNLLILTLLASTIMLTKSQQLNMSSELIELQLDEVIVTSQHGQQRLLDIPASITAISASTLDDANVVSMEQLAGFVPGLNILTQTPGRPNLVIRGLTSDEVSPTAQPRVSVYFNNAPISRATMAVTELYDMQRVEVMKGPQGTLFGRGSQAGAISFITQKPTQQREGYITYGIGDYAMTQFETAINLPLTDGLAMRFGGIYSYRDGYVKNTTTGGTLNDKNTIAGRFSLALTPQNRNLNINFTVNYQRDDNAGTAFISDRDNVFKYKASLAENKDFFNMRDVFLTILKTRYYVNDDNYFTSNLSVVTNKANSRFDGDGTIAPAIDMEEIGNAQQFTHELRYNFSTYNGRFKGIMGTTLWRENVNHTYIFRPGEQYLAALMMIGFDMEFLLPPGYQMVVNGRPNPLPALNVGPGVIDQVPSGINMELPDYHVEDNYTESVNTAYDVFFDATFEITTGLSITAGVRTVSEKFSIINRATHVDGEASVLGAFSGRSPNFFFKPVDNPKRGERYSARTWRAGLMYQLDNEAMVFAGYARGHRPIILQYDAQGEYEVVKPEVLHSFDAGYRLVKQRFMADAVVYYNRYLDFQSWRWEGMDYRTANVDKATSYGAELSGRYLVNQYFNVFGNYNYAFTEFDDRNNNGRPQINRGNRFRLTPLHSFQVGMTAAYNVHSNVRLSITPSYTWKDHIFFEDANDPGIEQDAYGLLNANLAAQFMKQRLTISLFGSNLISEKYLVGAGNMGAMFGIPTYVPGAPRMMGAKLKWNF
jgi:outer membrane receptor protein involved in Fe transport